MRFEDVAALRRDAFIDVFGGLFEHSPWIAEAAWDRRPFADEAALHAAMMGAVHALPTARQVAFIRLHPELAGREASAGTMTGHSTTEQGGAGLGRLTSEEKTELQRLNAAYLERHGFPFVIAVLAHTKAQIFDAARRRADHDTPTEIAAALAQISQITRARLRRVLSAA